MQITIELDKQHIDQLHELEGKFKKIYQNLLQSQLMKLFLKKQYKQRVKKLIN
ncbi:MAG: hypothetical protein GQ569_03820 [Methylococcaceae bacterium]|nr:hypothetical protein [Methylococcaceae bacterium]